MDISIVHSVLLAKLNTVANIGEVSSENENYRAANRVDYVRFSLRSKETQVMTVGRNPKLELGGLALIDVYTARGNGTAGLFTRASAIVEAFNPTILTDGTNFVHVLSSWAEGVLEDDKYVSVPVFVRWSARHSISN